MAILGTTGHERFFDCAAQRSEKPSDEIHSAATLRTPQTLKEEFWLEKCE
jgi:hypothetical protein